MKPDREDVIRQVEAGKLSRNKAAKILGLSRTRVGVIVKERKAKMNPPAPAYTPTPAAAPAPAPAAWTPEGKSELESLLRQANAAPIGGPPPPAPPPAAPAPAADPRKAEAGKVLAEMATTELGVAVATQIFGVQKTDPRIADLHRPNRFLEISLDLNSDKTAMLGELASGIKGLIIGTVIEAARAFHRCASLGLPMATVGQPKPPVPLAEPPDPEEEEPEDDAPGEVVDGGGFSIRRAKEEARTP